MAVLIEGVEMPKGNDELRLIIRSNGQVIISHKTYYEETEAVPVPPHGRLGDLDKLEQMFADIDHAPYSGFDGIEPFYSAEDAAQIIRLAPTIIPASEESKA